jgi:hypothetical protein
VVGEDAQGLERVMTAFTIRDAVDLVGDAKSQAGSVLRRWDQLGDVEASSGELERAIELLDRVQRDLEPIGLHECRHTYDVMRNIERDYAELGVAVREYASTVAAGGNGLRERREVEAAITALAIQHKGSVSALEAIAEDRVPGVRTVQSVVQAYAQGALTRLGEEAGP